MVQCDNISELYRREVVLCDFSLSVDDWLLAWVLWRIFFIFGVLAVLSLLSEEESGCEEGE